MNKPRSFLVLCHIYDASDRFIPKKSWESAHTEASDERDADAEHRLRKIRPKQQRQQHADAAADQRQTEKFIFSAHKKPPPATVCAGSGDYSGI